MNTEYVINEEIVRQTLEVVFQTKAQNLDEWFICFSNPTAGPWKKISFITKDGHLVKIGGYEKEETRPDLIIFSRKYGILLIIEAKDYVHGLLAESDKIKETFEKEEQKISRLDFIKDEFSKLFVIYGVVFFSGNPNDDNKKVEEKYLGIENLFTFVVTQDSSGNLNVQKFSKITDSRVQPLQKIIPS